MLGKHYTYAMRTSLLFFILCLQLICLDIHATTLGYVKLKRGDQGKLEGCWKDQDPVLSMCFYISDRLMRITYSQTGRMLAFYHINEDKNMHYIQVLGFGLLSYKTMEIRLPMLFSKYLARKAIKRKVKQLTSGNESPSRLYLFVKEILQTNKRWAFLKTTGRKLLTANEVAALENISSALRKHSIASRFQKTVERFNLLCMGLIRSVGPSKTSSDVSQDCHNQIPASKISNAHQQRPGFEKNFLTNKKWTSLGCADMRNGTDEECFGMCGTKCWCWDWVCGDCCLHNGCLQHDACCRCASPHYLSTYCLLPFIYGFDCKNGYNGYPECLYN